MLASYKTEKRIVSNPLDVLPVKNAKAIRNCTEMHLGKQDICEIANFDRFTNLEVLYLNSNKVYIHYRVLNQNHETHFCWYLCSLQISKLENLEHCFRLKELYVQNNNISTLKGSLSGLRYLTRLCLSGNQLKNLEATLPLLQHMKQLENLDLFGNPLAEELDYRLHVIYKLPTLKLLDRHGKFSSVQSKLVCSFYAGQLLLLVKENKLKDFIGALSKRVLSSQTAIRR